MLHPQFFGTAYIWWRTTGRTTQILLEHGAADRIRRDTGEALRAVLWSSDLRGFTERSDRLAGDRMITILNLLFEAKAIHDHGGEILKCVGDGLLAIFPIEDAGRAGDAAHQAIAAVRRLSDDTALADEPPLQIVVALHAGTVIYGNIGVPDRLDFTVIGPAVNLVSRVEAMAKALDLPMVVSEDFARRPMTPLGSHRLHGLSTPRNLLAPDLPSQ